MTENKRFKVTDNTNNPYLCDWNVTDYADGGIVHHPMTSENMANVICDLLNEFHEENKQLKQELKDYYNAFDCSQCRHQNYDWFDDGDEFEVCDKGNNESQMDNHSCKEWEEL